MTPFGMEFFSNDPVAAFGGTTVAFHHLICFLTGAKYNRIGEQPAFLVIHFQLIVAFIDHDFVIS